MVVEEIGAGRTVGVEEEFLLVDPVSGQPVDGADEVLVRAAGLPGPAPDAAVHAELLGTQVEAATGVCVDLAELERQVEQGRRRLAAAAEAGGLWLVASGTPVLAGAPVPPSPGERFGWIATRYAGVVADYHSCGCHVHVGVPDRDTAVGVLNHLAPWLPTLLALSANSPFDRGADTGYASWRMVTQSRFPGSGLAPWFGSAAAYDDQVDALVDCGVLADRHQSFWLARLSPRLPTVELRVADTAATVAGAVLQAALSRALVRTALAELAAGREAAPVDGQLAAAAVWSAARYGLRGPAVHLPTGRPVAAARLLAELVDLVSPALAEAGDLAVVRAELAVVSAEGTGADHQRRAAAGGPLAVVRLLAERTLRNPAPIGES
ncbi:MAG TPA: glutamate--cysteine ligase [Actinophytocola sp.]|nr:glutamate--cysteine ligase [Actinophytocola sp.]HEU5475898.1 glutamate--cysteine ligase [Actinophytocola sp.]